MTRKTVTPDQRILRSGTFGILIYVLGRVGPRHGDMNVHQIAVHKPRIDALVNWGGAADLVRCLRLTARKPRREGKDRKGYERAQGHYSAAIGFSPRAFALALSSAISWLARATGLVR